MVSLSLLMQTTNGYARASGRIHQAIESYNEVTGIRPRHVYLSPTEELDLRDITERQAGPEGLCASRAPTHSWRAFLSNHFGREEIEVHFDAPDLHADDRSHLEREWNPRITEEAARTDRVVHTRALSAYRCPGKQARRAAMHRSASARVPSPASATLTGPS